MPKNDFTVIVSPDIGWFWIHVCDVQSNGIWISQDGTIGIGGTLEKVLLVTLYTKLRGER